MQRNGSTGDVWDSLIISQLKWWSLLQTLHFQALDHLHLLFKENLDMNTDYHFQRCIDAPFKRN